MILCMKLLDDLDLYSDLVSSVGTGTSDRTLDPIECSDLIIRLIEETGETREQLSKRLGLGKKRKIKTLDAPPDTTQIRLFESLQALSRKNAYMLGFGGSDVRVPFTVGCLVAALPDKNDHNIILKTVKERLGAEKPIRKTDVITILNRKRKSPDQPIEEIIEHVMNFKPVTELAGYAIGLKLDPIYLLKIDEIVRNQQKDANEILKKLLESRFKNNEISAVQLKKYKKDEVIIWITISEENFSEIEQEWKSKRKPVTKFFSEILMEGVENN